MKIYKKKDACCLLRLPQIQDKDKLITLHQISPRFCLYQQASAPARTLLYVVLFYYEVTFAAPPLPSRDVFRLFVSLRITSAV